MDSTRPVRTNTADCAGFTPTTQGYVRILVCTVCFQWNLHTNRVHSSALRVVTTELRCRWIPSTTTKITSCLGSDGQHAPRTHKHCRLCGIHAHDTGVRAHTCLHGLFSVEPSYQPGTFQCTTSCNNRLRCRSKPSTTTKITSCLRSDGQHAPRTHKHCRPCGIHAHDTGVRAHTCLHGLFSVEHSYQPGTFQCTSS